MSKKALLGVLVALIGGVAAIPAGTAMAAPSCPAGTAPKGDYCENVPTGSKDTQPKTNKKDDTAFFELSCDMKPSCPGGVLYLQPGGTFAKVHAAARGDYGQAAYGPLLYGQSQTVAIPLTPMAQAALKKAGHLTFSTYSVSSTGVVASLGMSTLVKSSKTTKSKHKKKKHKKKKHTKKHK